MTIADVASTSVLDALNGESSRQKRHLPVLPVAELLAAQRSLTAVDRFAKLHDSHTEPTGGRLYSDLVPLHGPRAGEQYAFEVDLDACTGCKACVAACHTLNGLDESETWRTVGLLIGGTPSAPVQQTITTSCHHCLEPACMQGCPTKAYEKDPATGIVKHLDDQCFGCQYCTLMCPYDAPKYNPSRGIVRKCDMCSDRLAHGEAPACVQACPNGAIAIRSVEQRAVVASADAGQFLPGAPVPEHTLPTTAYRSDRPLPPNVLPADFYRTRPEHAHPSLVVMLTLTQLSAGALGIGYACERVANIEVGDPSVQAAFACALALVALAASVFHLGRPLLAWRAVLGLRTSWLSREALAFGIFAKLSILYGVLSSPLLAHRLGAVASRVAPGVHASAAIAGSIGVLCSVMVYAATRREQWSAPQTAVKFFGTSVLLGTALVVTITAWTLGANSENLPGVGGLLRLIAAVALLKAGLEAWALSRRRDRLHSASRRVAIVMLGDLRAVTLARFALLASGGLLLPLALGALEGRAALRVVTLGMLLLLIAAEACERYLFFRSAPASRMPGAIT